MKAFIFWATLCVLLFTVIVLYVGPKVVPGIGETNPSITTGPEGTIAGADEPTDGTAVPDETEDPEGNMIPTEYFNPDSDAPETTEFITE